MVDRAHQLSAIRWGGKFVTPAPVSGARTIEANQFLDLMLPCPPLQLALSLYAIADPGAAAAAVTIQWIVSVGNGSLLHEERFQQLGADQIDNQRPIVIARPANRLFVRALITTTVLLLDSTTFSLVAQVGTVDALDKCLWMPDEDHAGVPY